MGIIRSAIAIDVYVPMEFGIRSRRYFAWERRRRLHAKMEKLRRMIAIDAGVFVATGRAQSVFAAERSQRIE